MTRRPRALLLAASVLVTLWASVPGALPASAHEADDYYVHRWQGDLDLTYRFTKQVPATPAVRARINSGAGKWNALGQSLTMRKRGVDLANYDPYVCPSSPRKNGIHWREIDGPGATAGSALTCWTSTGALYSFQVIFDHDENWYTGTGTPAPGQMDLASVSAHEFGHAAGFGAGADASHFSAATPLCPLASTLNTLCPAIVSGTTWSRSLAWHDRHTFRSAY